MTESAGGSEGGRGRCRVQTITWLTLQQTSPWKDFTTLFHLWKKIVADGCRVYRLRRLSQTLLWPAAQVWDILAFYIKLFFVSDRENNTSDQPGGQCTLTHTERLSLLYNGIAGDKIPNVRSVFFWRLLRNKADKNAEREKTETGERSQGVCIDVDG